MTDAFRDIPSIGYCFERGKSSNNLKRLRTKCKQLSIEINMIKIRIDIGQNVHYIRLSILERSNFHSANV